MAIAPPDVHTAKFLTALDEFMESSPRLPEGAADSLKELGQNLRGYSDQAMSPGEKEIKQAHAPTDGTGNPYPQAATGQDVPSPGQREFLQATERMMAEVSGGGPNPNQ